MVLSIHIILYKNTNCCVFPRASAECIIIIITISFFLSFFCTSSVLFLVCLTIAPFDIEEDIQVAVH